MADRFRGRGQRMQKHWHVIPGLSANVTASSTLLGGGLTLDGPFTVLRMLGDYAIAPGATGTVAGDAADVAVAIGVVSADAFAAGAASVPDPGSTDPDYPWLFWAQHSVFFASTTVDPSSAIASVRRSFDVRSMRKMKPRETLALVVEYVDTAGAPPLRVEVAVTRVLVAT